MIKTLKNLLRREPAKTEPELRVLFVCTGNICRSPTAEGVFRARLKAAGLAELVDVASAGTHAHRGSPPDTRAQQFALLRGYDLSAIRSRQLLAEDFARFDRLLVMDEDNLRALQNMQPSITRAAGAADVELLMKHAARHPSQREVPDPYYGSPQGFEHVLDLVEDACDGLLQTVKASLER